ncbi:MAG: peptidyl-prolyl cis-trans isomerase [Burkholderiales bacterium]|nr:peptidyl-prolyl cis-trans isomerase [Burkholderiales bacterium]
MIVPVFELAASFRRAARRAVCAAVALAACLPAWAANPVVEIATSAGTLRAELYADKAPKTVENFLQYAKERFFDGTIFHRVIPGFMVQGGGFTPDMEQKKTRDPIANEAQNGLKNTAGTLAMARTPNPHSATAQFFINVADNDFLNFTGPTQQGFGYCVFGKITQGMDVVNKIVAVPTGNRGPHQNVPLKPIVIQSVRIVSSN